MENEKYGIEETIDVLQFVCALGNAIDESLSDNDIDLFDVANFLPVLKKTGAAWTGHKHIPNELSDLSEEEGRILQDVLKDALQIKNTRIAGVSSKALKASIAITELVKAIKAARQHPDNLA